MEMMMPVTASARRRHTYIITRVRVYVRTYVNTYVLAWRCRHTYTHTSLHAYMHACVHAYIYTYLPKCIHTSLPYIHTHYSVNAKTDLTHLGAHEEASMWCQCAFVRLCHPQSGAEETRRDKGRERCCTKGPWDKQQLSWFSKCSLDAGH